MTKIWRLITLDRPVEVLALLVLVIELVGSALGIQVAELLAFVVGVF